MENTTPEGYPKPLCSKVRPKSILDDSMATDEDVPATCPTCAKRDPRFSKGLMTESKNSQIEKAVTAFRLYAGSMSTTNIKTQQKLYDRAVRACTQIAKAKNMEPSDVIEQISAEAKKRGPITPMPGKDI